MEHALIFAVQVLTLMLLIDAWRQRPAKPKKREPEKGARIPGLPLGNVIIDAAIAEALSVQARDPLHSGENKRHQVLAKMMKQFPSEEKWKIGLAIEWAIKTLKEQGEL